MKDTELIQIYVVYIVFSQIESGESPMLMPWRVAYGWWVVILALNMVRCDE